MQTSHRSQAIFYAVIAAIMVFLTIWGWSDPRMQAVRWISGAFALVTFNNAVLHMGKYRELGDRFMMFSITLIGFIWTCYRSDMEIWRWVSGALLVAIFLLSIRDIRRYRKQAQEKILQEQRRWKPFEGMSN